MSSSSLEYGYIVKESPVRTKSKGCTTKVSKEINKAKVLPSNILDILESCTRKDCSLVAQGECSPKVSNDKIIMPKIDKAKIIIKISREIVTKKQEFSFDHKISSELSFRESIPFVKQCLICIIFHRWLYKIKKLLKNSVKRINKISQDKISANFFKFGVSPMETKKNNLASF